MNTSFTQSTSITWIFLALLAVSGLTAWNTPEDPNTTLTTENPETFEMTMAPVVTGAWNRLTASQRTTLQGGGSVPGFDLGICDGGGQPILADITSGPAPAAPDPTVINTRLPRRWGNTSFYLALQNAGSAGVQYCFELNTAAPFSMDSREHAFLAHSENIRVTAQNAGTPVNLTGDLFGPGGSAFVSGSGTPEVHFSAGGQQDGGTWWMVSSAGQPVTEICIQYYAPGAGTLTPVEPFRLLVDGTKCVADDPFPCSSQDYISRWNQLSTSDRTKLENSIPVNGFNTGFCDESGDPIHFIEISAAYSPMSGNLEKNAHPPRPYGRYSFDNGREYIGNGGSIYCFTLEEASPVRLSSEEHMFFSGTEIVNISAFLGADPVPLTGFYHGGNVNSGPISSNGLLSLTGFGYGAGVWWSAGTDGQPASQVCVEYFVAGGVPLGREPFTMAICADRCLYDDYYACSQNPMGAPGCGGLSDIKIDKEVYPLNGNGLNTCNNPGGGTTNPVFGIRLTMTAVAGTFKNLFLEEDLLAYFGAAYVDTVSAPVITASTAAGNPLIDPLFDGRNWTNLFLPGTGALYNGQSITIEFSVELNPNAPGAVEYLINSVYGGGDPAGAYIGQDLSGGLSQGYGMPTAIQTLPPGYTAVSAQDLTLEATLPNYMNGIQPWLADNGGAEFSIPGCNSVTWTNDYDPDNWVQGCGQITGSVDVTFTASACGFTFVTSATFTLEDTQGPACTKPEDLSLDCNDPDANDILQDWLDYDGAWTDLSQPVTFTNDFTGLTGNECNGDSILVTWTATDACGNTTNFSAYLTVIDDTAPAFQNLPADLTLDLCSAIPDTADVTATDACDPDVDVIFEETQTGDDCHFTISRTWTATDDCGNSASYTQTINVSDDDPPVFTNVPADLTIECPDTIPAPQDPDVTDCSGFTLTFDEIQIGGACPLPSQVVRTWIATDDCGNVDSVKQVITVESPTNTGTLIFTSDPQDITVTCDQNPGFDDVQAETTCPDGGLSVSFSDVVNNNGDCSQPFSVTRTWIAHDACGNMITIDQTLNIGPDTEAPIFDAANPDTIMVDCGDDITFPVAFDNCGPTALTYEDTDETGDCDTGFTFTRNWTATDLCGNTSTFSQVVITGPDNTPPVFTFVPYDQFFDCDDTIVFDNPIAVDNCGEVTITFQDSIIGTGDCNEVNGIIYGYDIIRTWIATDDCGNASTAITSAWVLPGFNSGNLIGFSHVPGNKTIGCGDAMDFGQAVCHSACGEVTLTYEDEYDGDCANGTMVTRTWIATDDCGNQISAVQEIFIEPDKEAPVFDLVPANGTYDCNNGDPVFGTPQVSDNCADGTSIALIYVDIWQNNGTGCNGFSVTRTWTAIDPCGNESTASQQLVLQDDVAPAFDFVPQDETIGCGEPIVFGSPEVTDACANVMLTFTDEITDICGGTYAVTRTWTATDACGNESVASQTVTVADDVAPVFDFVPTDLTISCGDPIVFGTPEVSDACTTVDLTYTDETETFCEGTYTVTRTWTAKDACDNEVQASQSITVEDQEAPVFTTTVDPLFIQCGDPLVFDDVEATDGCGQVSLTYTDATEVGDCETVVTRTWIAADDCGNTTELSQQVTITDEEAPLISGLPAQLEMTKAEYDLWTAPAPDVTDCSQTSVERIVNSESSCDFLVYTHTYLVTDQCGNTSYHDLNVVITDAAFDMDVDKPSDLECGNTYELVAGIVNGEAPFSYSWQILSGTGWSISSVLGEPIAMVEAGEGTAEISVEVTDANGCTTSQQFTLECATATAVASTEIQGLRLMPNPAVDFLSVNFQSTVTDDAKIGIVNTLGKYVTLRETSVTMGANHHVLDVADLPAGTYFLVMQMNGSTVVEKFVKLR